MTNEEFERLKDSIRANLTGDIRALQPDEKVIEARRKLDRDMDRLERALERAVGANPRARERMRKEDERRREFEWQLRERFAEIKEFAARSDQKLKALIDETRNAPNKHTQ